MVVPGGALGGAGRLECISAEPLKEWYMTAVATTARTDAVATRASANASILRDERGRGPAGRLRAVPFSGMMAGPGSTRKADSATGPAGVLVATNSGL